MLVFIGSDAIQKDLRPYALDKSSLAIGTIKY